MSGFTEAEIVTNNATIEEMSFTSVELMSQGGSRATGSFDVTKQTEQGQGRA